MRHRLQSRYWNSNSLPVECWVTACSTARSKAVIFIIVDVIIGTIPIFDTFSVVRFQNPQGPLCALPFLPLQDVHYGTRVIGPAASAKLWSSLSSTCRRTPQYSTRFRRRELRSGRASGSAQRASVRESGPHELLSRPRAHTGFSSASASALWSPSCLPLPFVAVP